MTTLLLLIGISGSGKSTYGKRKAKELNFEYISSDELRARFGKDESDQSVTPQVFNYIKTTVDNLLSNGKSVMVDATNLTKRDRKDYLDSANRYRCEKVAVVFERDKETLIANQEKRFASGGRRVPDFVIEKMLLKYQPPDKSEFDEIVYK